MAGAGRLAEALAEVEQGLVKTPRDPAALGLKAALLTETGRPEDALPVFRRALSLDPRNAALHSNQGNALAKLQRTNEAIQSFDRALAINPNYGAALLNRAAQRLELADGEAALADIDRALRLNPNLAAAHRTRARALMLGARYAEALASAEAAAALQPAHPDAQVLRGGSLTGLGRHAESLAAHERALALNPQSVENAYNVALMRLSGGDFQRGWRESDCRWQLPSFAKNSTRYPSERLARLLDTRSAPHDIAGKTVLVIDEQGIGDQVMFCSMLPDLIAAGCSVTCFCEPRLMALLAFSFPSVRFLPAGGGLAEPLEHFDAVIAMGSLGRFYRNARSDFPGAPYLKAPPEVVDDWRNRLGPRHRALRVGLSWRGGLDQTNRVNRSMGLKQLLPLLSRDDCEFVSLQYGDHDAEIADINARLTCPIAVPRGEDLADFAQLAGALQSVDLVVSVQTSLIHLCGALGVPCLVMVPFVAEWRYGTTGDTMPWYNAVRLFRQTAPGAWDPVIAQVGQAIDAWPRR